MTSGVRSDVKSWSHETPCVEVEVLVLLHNREGVINQLGVYV